MAKTSRSLTPAPDDVGAGVNGLRPTCATLELTLHCNLSCSTCFADAATEGRTEQLTLPEVRRAVADLASVGCASVNLSGGEPTLHPDFFPIVECLREHQITPALATNGTTLSKSTCRRLAACGVRHNVYVSLDGADEESFGAIRGAGTFERVLAGLDNLRESGIRFAVSTVVLRQNQEDLDRILDLAASHGASFLNLVRFNREGRGARFYDELAPTGKPFEEICASVGNGRAGRPVFFGENWLVPISSTLPNFPEGRDLRNFVIVRATGEIRLGRASAGVVLGNIRAGSRLAEILAGEPARRCLNDFDEAAFEALIRERAERGACSSDEEPVGLE